MAFLSLKVSPRWKFLMALLLLTSIATYAFIRSEQIREHVENVWEINDVKTGILLDMRIALKGVDKALESFANPALDSAAVKKSYSEELVKYQWFETSVTKYMERSALTSRNEKAIMHKLALDRGEVQKTMQRVDQMLSNGQQAAIPDVIIKELRPGAMSRWKADVDELIAVENEANAQAGQAASASYEQLRTTVLLMCALVVILGLMAMWFTIKGNSDATAVA
ncbi:MAG: hypothetical protein HYZ45_10365 [Burkholderiales bacterium]|nr:hypothetical protein [Burkholderiales bacterium]